MVVARAQTRDSALKFSQWSGRSLWSGPRLRWLWLNVRARVNLEAKSLWNKTLAEQGRDR